MDLLREMQAEPSVKPDAVTYNAAMQACDTGGQWEQARSSKCLRKRQECWAEYTVVDSNVDERVGPLPLPHDRTINAQLR